MRREITGGLFGWCLSVALPLGAQSPILPPTGMVNLNPVVPTSTLARGGLSTTNALPPPVIVSVTPLPPVLPAAVSPLVSLPAVNIGTGLVSTSARPTPVYGYYATQWRTFPGSAASVQPSMESAPVNPEVTSRGAASDLIPGLIPSPAPVPSEAPDNPPLLPKHVDNKPTIPMPPEIERAVYQKQIGTLSRRPSVRIDPTGVVVAPPEEPAVPGPTLPATAPASRPRLGTPTVE